jgi:hypothetical protein
MTEKPIEELYKYDFKLLSDQVKFIVLRQSDELSKMDETLKVKEAFAKSLSEDTNTKS